MNQNGGRQNEMIDVEFDHLEARFLVTFLVLYFFPASDL